MINKCHWGTIGIILVAVTVHASDSKSGAWKAKMGELNTALTQTMPYLYPTPDQDKKALLEKVKKVYDLTRDLDLQSGHAVKAPDDDPALPYIANLFRQDVERAYLSIKEGHEQYGKGVLRSSISYCIACHTRTKSGVEFPLLNSLNSSMKSASWIEKIEFQAASRQFDSALTEVTRKLKEKGGMPVNSLDLERASRVALSIAVRVKKDPTRAAILAQAVAESPEATVSMKEAAKVWSRDIKDWQSGKDEKYKDAAELLNAAKELIKTPSTPVAFAHRDVRYLRATVLMHELLKKYPDSPQVPEALYIIGRSYDAIRDLGLWSLHEMYYLACINRAPHSALAESCFKNYEDSVVLGYSGSSGVNVPAAIRHHLRDVEAKAKK